MAPSLLKKLSTKLRPKPTSTSTGTGPTPKTPTTPSSTTPLNPTTTATTYKTENEKSTTTTANPNIITSLTQTITSNHTITTTALLTTPPTTILTILHTPSHYFFLNPYIKTLTPIVPNSEYTATEEVPLVIPGLGLRVGTLKVTQHAKIELREDGIVNVVESSTGCGLLRTKTRSVYVVTAVDEKEGGSGCKVEEVFEVLEVASLLRAYVVKTVAEGNKRKVEVLAEKVLEVAAGV